MAVQDSIRDELKRKKELAKRLFEAGDLARVRIVRDQIDYLEWRLEETIRQDAE